MKSIIIAILIITTFALASCVPTNQTNGTTDGEILKESNQDTDKMVDETDDDSKLYPAEDDPSEKLTEMTNKDWKEFQLKNINTNTEFKISDYKGKPVLVESFAVWCPTCTRQQKVLIDFHKDVGDEVVSISLDTDPNEDEQKVKDHTSRNGFHWNYAIAPAEMTKLLIEEFGIGIVNAPSVPMILVCEDQTTRLLGRGVKSVNELKAEIAKGC